MRNVFRHKTNRWQQYSFDALSVCNNQIYVILFCFFGFFFHFICANSPFCKTWNVSAHSNWPDGWKRLQNLLGSCLQPPFVVFWHHASLVLIRLGEVTNERIWICLFSGLAQNEKKKNIDELLLTTVELCVYRYVWAAALYSSISMRYVRRYPMKLKLDCAKIVFVERRRKSGMNHNHQQQMCTSFIWPTNRWNSCLLINVSVWCGKLIDAKSQRTYIFLLYIYFIRKTRTHTGELRTHPRDMQNKRAIWEKLVSHIAHTLYYSHNLFVLYSIHISPNRTNMCASSHMRDATLGNILSSSAIYMECMEELSPSEHVKHTRSHVVYKQQHIYVRICTRNIHAHNWQFSHSVAAFRAPPIIYTYAGRHSKRARVALCMCIAHPLPTYTCLHTGGEIVGNKKSGVAAHTQWDNTRTHRVRAHTRKGARCRVALIRVCVCVCV